jgi:HD-GYP domain-containing protein (c-di-GMP phosphodiesterase class II)
LQSFRALRLAFIYILFSTLWIGISDRVLFVLVQDPDRLTYFQSIKGWLFVILSGLLILVLQYIEYQREQQWDVQLQEQTGSMQNLIENIPGIVYRTKASPERPLKYISATGAQRLSIKTSNGKPEERVDLLRFISEADRHQVENQLKEAIKNNSSYQLNYELVNAEQERFFVLDIGRVRKSGGEDEYILEGVLSDITALQSAQKELFSKVLELGSLRAIDQAILSTKSLPEVMEIIMEQIRISLGPRAIKIYLADTEMASETQDFYYDPDEVFKRDQKPQDHAEEIQIAPITGSDQNEVLVMISDPLQGRGGFLGHLRVVVQEAKSRNTDWRGHFKTIAGQLSIALEHMKVMDELKQSNQELTSAQSNLLTGWARALEYKDRETLGHSDRVTDLMRKFSTEMGINGHHLEHMIRGALLHDIGKMAIPDAILHKPGPLTEDEWEIMKKHPIYAESFLRDVEFLEEAMIIPLYHHERWDGSGYPFGLKGEDIPLAARMFAIIDRWDALTHDRPYRKAWSQTKAIEHLHVIAGGETDPELTPKFLKIIFEDKDKKSMATNSGAHAPSQE